MNPRENSCGGRQRLGSISKQGNTLMRWLLVEAAQTAARLDPQLKRFYRRLAVRKNRSVAKVAVARKLATRLYLMLREDWTYAQLNQAVMQVSPSHSVVGAGSDRLSGQPASLNSRGVRSEQSWVQVPKRWMVGPESRCGIEGE